MGVSRNEFKQNLMEPLWKGPFMTLRKLGFIIYQHEGKLIFSDKFCGSVPYKISICGKVNGIHGKFHLRPSAK
jgi:hypothetical protein